MPNRERSLFDLSSRFDYSLAGRTLDDAGTFRFPPPWPLSRPKHLGTRQRLDLLTDNSMRLSKRLSRETFLKTVQEKAGCRDTWATPSMR